MRRPKNSDYYYSTSEVETIVVGFKKPSDCRYHEAETTELIAQLYISQFGRHPNSTHV